MGDLLGSLDLPGDLSRLNRFQLKQLADEIRSFMIKTVADNGGHLAPNLGVVELTLALHSTFSSPRDRIIWDVGHQCYVHKMLTGRLDRFHTLRQQDGLSGFPKPSESGHDPFGTGHSSTSISAALGLAIARDRNNEQHQVIAVIGDGALTGGMSYEALNHAGHLKHNLLVVLNDNKMSISNNVGAMSNYLGRLRSDPKYSRFKMELEQALGRLPFFGKQVVQSAERFKGGLKYLLMPGMIFEELGLTYLGPVDGHDITAMQRVFRQAGRFKGPVLVHVLTEKGKGYHYAERSPERFHGIGPFDLNNGRSLGEKQAPSYTDLFAGTIVKLAAQNKKIVAISAAMAVGTGLDRFAEAYPDRFFDVGIAEQHAVTLAAAMAAGGLKPIVAIYSTFLQRAYDQLIHDVCLQNLPVVFAVDRAGIVGEDGETHQGLFDLSFLRSIPNMAIMAPSNEEQLQHMLFTALSSNGPVAIRYPRASVEGVELTVPRLLPWGKGELLREGEDILFVAAGPVVNETLRAAEKLFWQGISAAVIDARFVKPLDGELIATWARKCRQVITVEENNLAGGFGSAVAELLEGNNLFCPVKRIGVGDCFVKQGSRPAMLAAHGLDAESICRAAVALASQRAAKGNGSL